MRSHEDDAEYHKVPSLGKHYSQKWALEDMQDEQKEGTRISSVGVQHSLFTYCILIKSI